MTNVRAFPFARRGAYSRTHREVVAGCSGAEVVPMKRAGSWENEDSSQDCHWVSVMKRASVYPYTIKEPPGATVHRLRELRGWSQRELAARCVPELEHTTIRRIEQNQGFTMDTLARVAKALGCRSYVELFTPVELADLCLPDLPEHERSRILGLVQDLVWAWRKRR